MDFLSLKLDYSDAACYLVVFWAQTHIPPKNPHCFSYFNTMIEIDKVMHFPMSCEIGRVYVFLNANFGLRTRQCLEYKYEIYKYRGFM